MSGFPDILFMDPAENSFGTKYDRSEPIDREKTSLFNVK
jgi:hypothetical protein